jgi:predicted TIM-barrel fold metal-dependent hydrolase
MKTLSAGALAFLVTTAVHAQEAPPIIDMHLHALPVGLLGPGTIENSPRTAGLNIRVPDTDEENLARTLDVMRANNIVKGVVSGRLGITREWVEADPERFIPGIALGSPRTGHSLDEITPERIALEHQQGRLEVLGEITTQYVGLSPSDIRLDPYFQVAEEEDIPVLIHTAGLGAPTDGFRIAAGRPLLLEEALLRHPNLRIYVENAGYPFLEDMLALFNRFPERLYADVSTVIRLVPREEFYRYLRILTNAGFADRIMFGSDQVLWPDTIQIAIETIESADFLSEEQKRDIFYNNAARFLRLTDAEIASHHGN